MVETRSLFNAGLKSGAVDNDAIMVGVKEGYRLIAAPATSTHSSYAVMIWEPTDDQDCKPTYDKVVRIFSDAICFVTEGTRFWLASTVPVIVVLNLRIQTPNTFGSSVQHQPIT